MRGFRFTVASTLAPVGEHRDTIIAIGHYFLENGKCDMVRYKKVGGAAAHTTSTMRLSIL